MKKILSLLLTASLALATAITISCSSGGGGGGFVDPIAALNGTWKSSDEEITLNGGNFEASQNNKAFAKGTYTTQETRGIAATIAMTVKEVHGDFLNEILEEEEIDITFESKWYDKSQLIAAFRRLMQEKYPSISTTELDKLSEMFDDIFPTMTGTVDGDTMTVDGDRYTKVPGSGGGNLGGGKSDPYFETFNSGTYHIKTKTTMEGIEAISDFYSKDGMMASEVVAMDMNMNMKTRTIIRDNKSYSIIENLYMNVIIVCPLKPSDKSGQPPVQTTGMRKTGSGTAKFNEKNLPYEEYSDGKGSKVQYFFNGDKLEGIRAIVDRTTADMVILELDKNVPANAFDIPSSGYTPMECTD